MRGVKVMKNSKAKIYISIFISFIIFSLFLVPKSSIAQVGYGYPPIWLWPTWPTKSLTRVEISGPNALWESWHGSYGAIAYFSDKTSYDVTNSAIWSEYSPYASMDPYIKGRVITSVVYHDESFLLTATYTYNGVTKTGYKYVTILDNQGTWNP